MWSASAGPAVWSRLLGCSLCLTGLSGFAVLQAAAVLAWQKLAQAAASSQALARLQLLPPPAHDHGWPERLMPVTPL